MTFRSQTSKLFLSAVDFFTRLKSVFIWFKTKKSELKIEIMEIEKCENDASEQSVRLNMISIH